VALLDELFLQWRHIIMLQRVSFIVSKKVSTMSHSQMSDSSGISTVAAVGAAMAVSATSAIAEKIAVRSTLRL